MPVFSLRINSQTYTVTAAPDTPLLWVLRDELGLKGTKYGCGKGLCGACTVHFNGNAVRSCQIPLTIAVKGRITTIEGLSTDGSHPVQKAWIAADVPQCGYCQAGQIMTAAALLAHNKNPNETEIDAAMAGNLCRCGTYMRIRKAIQLATQKGGNL